MARVDFAYPYTGADGKQYQQGQSADIDPGLASKLVSEGIARRPESPKPGPVNKNKEA